MKNLTEGSPAKLIIGLFNSYVFGNAVSAVYSMVDDDRGKVFGIKTVGGVGSTGSLNFMVIGFCIGVCNGLPYRLHKNLARRMKVLLRRFVANAHGLCRFCGRDDTGIVCF